MAPIWPVAVLAQAVANDWATVKKEIVSTCYQMLTKAKKKLCLMEMNITVHTKHNQ